MSIKLLLPVLFALLLVTSCKKGPNGPGRKNTTYKMLEFNASATSAIKVVIKIIRPATDGGSVDVQLVHISQSNITVPYQYKDDALQSGDHVSIAVFTTQNKAITGLLLIDGANIEHTYNNLSTTASQSTTEWDYYVD